MCQRCVDIGDADPADAQAVWRARTAGRRRRPWPGYNRVIRCGAAYLYRHAWVLLAVVVLFTVVCSTPAFAQWLRRGLTGPYPAQVAAEYPVADAVVVLGGGWMRDTEDVLDNPLANDPHTRLGFGRLLYVAGRAPMILLSGGDGEAKRMAASLVLQDVPRAHLLIESRSRDTHENALYSAELLHRAGVHRILLVTSTIHMGRAVASFTKQGMQVIPAPVMPMPQRDRPVSFWHARRIALFRSGNYLHEYFGRWIYRLRGWS